MKRGLDWYAREPRAFVDGVRAAKMTARQIAVYTVALDLIYDGGGETPDDPKHIASYFSDMGTSAARATIEELVQMGKLYRVDGMLHQKRAENSAKTRANLREIRSEAGRLGGISSGKSRRKSLEDNDPNEANASSKHEPEKRREEYKEEEGARTREAGFAEEGQGAVEQPTAPSEPPPSTHPTIPPGLLDDVRAAVGIQSHDTGAYWADPSLAEHVAAWIGSGLAPDRIVAEAKASRAKNPEPPDGPRALDRWMAQAASAKASTALVKPAAKAKPATTPVSPEDRLNFFADWVNGDKLLPASVISPVMARALLESGKVTQERMRERGVR